MVSHGIGVAYGSAELANVLVNGKRLGEIVESKRTPDKHDIRPETKFREAFSIAVAAVRLKLKNPRIETKNAEGTDRERPDALLHFDGGEVGVEAVRVAPTHREQNFTMNLQRELLAAIESDATLKAEGYLVTFRLSAGAISKLSNDERKKLKVEILELLRSGTIKLMPVNDRMTTVFAPGSAAQRAGMTVAIEDCRKKSSGFMPQVLLEQDARSDSLVQAILNTISDKIASAKSAGYDLSRPLWLVVEVADQSGGFEGSIAAMPTFMGIEPFERAIITDGRIHAEITNEVVGK